MTNVKILQMKNTMKAFMNYDYVMNHFGLAYNDYEEVYSCLREDTYNFDDAFKEFNINRPQDFLGHSLSVSDIVIINGIAMYCDSIGWRKVGIFH